MKRGRSTGNPTKAQKLRFQSIHLVGCIACLQQKPKVPDRFMLETEVHHLTVGGLHGQKRRGHDETIGLCRWHHRGENGHWITQPESMYGPSYARTPRRFRDTYGRDDVLLAYQNQLIQQLQERAA